MKLRADEFLSSLEKQNQQKASAQKQEAQHASLVKGSDETQTAVVQAAQLIIEFMQNQHQTVSVDNHPEFPESILTPDIDKVVNSLAEVLAATLANKPDSKQLEEKLDEVANQLRELPRNFEFPEMPEAVEAVTVKNQIDYTAKFDEMAEKFSNIELSPVIKVGATKVVVDTTEIAEVVASLKDVILGAISGIEMPQYPSFDQKPVLEALRALQKEIHDRPIVKPPSQVQTTDTPYAVELDDYTAANTLYIGKATPGTATTEAEWQIAKLDTSSGLIKTWAGTAGFNQIWDDRASLTYS